jgi:hypothetical protein
MREVFDFSLEAIKPDRQEVLRLQGIAPHIKPSKRIIALLDEAMEIFMNAANPVGIFSEVTVSKFWDIYKGQGKNEADTPLEHIFPRAEYLALFAFSLGIKISKKIEDLFQKKEFPLGAMLDALASSSAERAVHIAERKYFDFVSAKTNNSKSKVALLYSPGYCGWHISAQKKLFEYLCPEEVGISLNSSFLMIPLKSVSGVLIFGNKEIHVFTNNYLFCSHCQDKSCKQRINMIKK